MKKIGLLVLVLLVVGGGVFVYRWYNRSKNDPYKTFIKPRVEMSSFQITNLTKEKTEATMKVLIDNAAPVGFKADSLSYQIYMAGVEVMRSTYPKPIQARSQRHQPDLPAGDHRQPEDAGQAQGIQKRGDRQRGIHHEGAGAYRPAFLQGQALNLTFSKKMPAYIMPDVKLVDTDLDKLGLNRPK
jgi:hypothetical protein